MGSNGLDWKNVGIRSYPAGNKGVRVERSLGEAGMQSEPGHSPPAPPLTPSPSAAGTTGPDPAPRGGHVPTVRPQRGGLPGRRWKSGTDGECAQPCGASLRRHLPFSFRSSAVRCRVISWAPLRMARQPPPFLLRLAQASASPHLTTPPPWPARDGGRREARPKIQRNADAGASCACEGRRFHPPPHPTPVTKE